MCNCGCNTCETKNTALVINESIAPKTILSEGLKYHIDNNKPLTEHLYRAGSRAYFDLFAEARSLYSRGILEFTHEDDLALLKETHLGHFGMFEGKRVPLDFPIEIDEAYEVNGKRIPADLTIAGKKVKAIHHNDSKNIEDHEIEYEDGTKEPYLKHIIKEAAKKKKGP